MYLYVDRLLLLFCVLLAVFLCAVLLILADYLAWVARFRISGERPAPFLRADELLGCFYLTAGFLIVAVIGYWYAYLSGVLEVALG